MEGGRLNVSREGRRRRRRGGRLNAGHRGCRRWIGGRLNTGHRDCRRSRGGGRPNAGG